MNNPITSLIIEGRAGESNSSSWQTESPPQWDPLQVVTVDWTSDVNVRANAVGVLKARTLNAIADPAITLWETRPYSFVADWFVNIGDVLAAWKVQTSMRSLYASLGYRQMMSAVTNVRTVAPGSYETADFSAHGSERYEAKARIPASIPSLVPSFTVRLTSKRIADAAALLAKRIL